VKKKFKVILSDLHLGIDTKTNFGKPAISQTLVQFLQELAQESEERRREVELILNGDIFDFLQIPGIDDETGEELNPIDIYFDSSEATALKRLSYLAKTHAEIFTALANFIQIGPPKRRITLIKGDHDVQLYWPTVKSRLRDLLTATGQRSSLLLFAGEFINREDIYIEHGHQQAGKGGYYPDFIDPRHQDDHSQLYYAPNTIFQLNLLRETIPQPWLINSIKPTTTLIWYALSWNFNLAVNILNQFLPEVSEPEVDQLREILSGSDTRRALAQRYANEIKFRQEFHYKLLHYLNLTVPPQDNPTTKNILNLFPSDPLIIGQAEQQHQRDLLRDAAELITQKNKAKVVIFGHTHYPSQESLSPGYVYINTGSWTHNYTVSPQASSSHLFADDLPTQFKKVEQRIPYARIDYDEQGKPIIAQLLYITYQDKSFRLVDLEPPPKPKTTNWLTSLFAL